MIIDYYKKITEIEDNRHVFNPTSYISNSSLSHINPDQGGHPQKFIDFFSQDLEEKASKALTSGKMIHKYVESPKEFIVADFELPASGTIGALVPEFLSKNYENLQEFSIIETSEDKEGNKKYKINNDDYYLSIIKQIGKSRPDSLNEDAVKYIHYLFSSKNKIALSKNDKDLIIKVSDSLKNNPKVSEYLFGNIINIGQNPLEINKGFRRYKEIAVYWTETINNQLIYRKSLIDNLLYFPETNVMIIIDLKTTSKSIYSFNSTENKRGTFESWNMDRQLGFYKSAIENLYSNETAYAITNEGNTIKLSNLDKPAPKIYAYIIPVETFGYYLTNILPVNDYTLMYGQRKVKNLLDRIVWHISRNVWDKSKEEFTLAGLLPTVDYSKIERLKNE